MNAFKFYTANHLFYNESNIYPLSSVDHLLKRRITSVSAPKIYTDILKDNQLFYYTVNVQDKRLGDHLANQRAHHSYEANIIALPFKNTYMYFVPRENGLKYHMNELPFYFEGAMAAHQASNFQLSTKNKASKNFKMMSLHQSTYLDNVRSETANIKVSVDSLLLRLNIMDSLSGQFSTILRPLYLNEIIDSTISSIYYKKCTDKPKAFDQKIKLQGRQSDFPYRYNFNCVEKIKTLDSLKIPLKNWFAFTLSKTNIVQAPMFDYYFDFAFKDVYTFNFEFNKTIEILNMADFETKINNQFFELNSEMMKNSSNKYLLKLTFCVKQNMIPASQSALLMELLDKLDYLNNLTLNYKRI